MKAEKKDKESKVIRDKVVDTENKDEPIER